jgi:hypothetical protein
MRSSNEGSRVPQKSFQRDPDKHYVLVERRNPMGPDYDSPVEDYLGGAKNGIVYDIVSEDRAVTGHSGKVLMACDRKEWEAAEEERVAMQNASLRQKANLSIPGYLPSLDKFEEGEAASLEKLAEALPEG